MIIKRRLLLDFNFKHLLPAIGILFTSATLLYLHYTYYSADIVYGGIKSGAIISPVKEAYTKVPIDIEKARSVFKDTVEWLDKNKANVDEQEQEFWYSSWLSSMLLLAIKVELTYWEINKSPDQTLAFYTTYYDKLQDVWNKAVSAKDRNKGPNWQERFEKTGSAVATASYIYADLLLINKKKKEALAIKKEAVAILTAEGLEAMIYHIKESPLPPPPKPAMEISGMDYHLPVFISELIGSLNAREANRILKLYLSDFGSKEKEKALTQSIQAELEKNKAAAWKWIATSHVRIFFLDNPVPPPPGTRLECNGFIVTFQDGQGKEIGLPKDGRMILVVDISVDRGVRIKEFNFYIEDNSPTQPSTNAASAPFGK